MTCLSSNALRSLLIVLVLAASVACSESAHDGPLVFANGEELRGAWEDGQNKIAVFKGIPFALPPVGELRWRAPVDHQPRSGPRLVDKFANACMQTSYSSDWYASIAESFGFGPEVVGWPVGISEDCLYLNVWSAKPNPGSSLPVMIWVHGGSNTGGWSYEPNYLGTRLADKGVVVVSIAYRMGSFGFFSHPLLDNGEGEPIANFGLLDISQAIRWVKNNIDAFGGNPDNITLIGESSGAGDISDLVISDMGNDPVYKRAILQSSASGLAERRTLAQEKALGQHLMDSFELSGGITAERLREIPARDILDAYTAELKGHYFDAVIDGLTMKQSPIDVLREADKSALDILIGTNADEWLMYIDKNVSQADLEKIAAKSLPGDTARLFKEIIGAVDIRQAVDRIRTAVDTLCPSRYLASRVTDLGGKGRVYWFSRQRPGPGGEELGAYHGTEIPYVFDTHDDWLPTEELDRELTRAVMDYWVRFAMSGDPNLPERPAWPVFSKQEGLVMQLGNRVGSFKPNDAGLCELVGPDRTKGD